MISEQIKKYINYCNTPIKPGASLQEILIKGFSRAMPLGLFMTLFTLGHVYNNAISLIALGLGTLFLVYLLGLI
jgi:hypothetical protein